MPVPRYRRIALRGLVAAVVAALLNAALVPVARMLAIAPGFEPIAYPPVVFLTVLGVLAGTAVFAAVTRLSTTPGAHFTQLAMVALALSVVPDVVLLFADENATVPGVLVLVLMHVVAAVVAVRVLVRGVGRQG